MMVIRSAASCAALPLMRKHLFYLLPPPRFGLEKLHKTSLTVQSASTETAEPPGSVYPVQTGKNR